MSNFVYENDELPENQPASSGFKFPGVVQDLGFTPTPEFKKTGPFPVKHQRMFVFGIDPLSFSYDRNPTDWRFEQQGNIRRFWMNYLNDKGEPINANSPFGFVKAAFQTLGYPIRNAADCEALRGRKFIFEAQEHKFGGKPISFDVPVQELPADYTWTGTKKDPIRQGYDSAPTVSADEEAADVEKLRAALEGKSQNEFIMAISAAGLGKYIHEASAGDTLVTRMKRHGMDVVDGRLVTVGK